MTIPTGFNRLNQPSECDEQEVAGGREVPDQHGNDPAQGAGLSDGGTGQQGWAAESVEVKLV